MRISSLVIAGVMFFGTLHVAVRHGFAWSAMAKRQIQAGSRGPLSLNEELLVALAGFVHKYVVLLEILWVLVVVTWVIVRVVRRLLTPRAASPSNAP